MEITPLSARSVVLSLMLGSHAARWTPAQLAAAGKVFELAPSTLRTALTRAVAAGDLERHDGSYVLGDRLTRRQRHQDEAVDDAERPWDGSWEMSVVVATGRPGGERAALRERLASYRMAELREGVWLRPANLRRPPAEEPDVLTSFTSRPEGDPAVLARTLWDLDAWAITGRALATRLSTDAAPGRRLAVAAALVRHLASDPLLPADLLPADWPGEAFRTAYASYASALMQLLRTEE